ADKARAQDQPTDVPIDQPIPDGPGGFVVPIAPQPGQDVVPPYQPQQPPPQDISPNDNLPEIDPRAGPDDQGRPGQPTTSPSSRPTSGPSADVPQEPQRPRGAPPRGTRLGARTTRVRPGAATPGQAQNPTGGNVVASSASDTTRPVAAANNA